MRRTLLDPRSDPPGDLPACRHARTAYKLAAPDLDRMLDHAPAKRLQDRYASPSNYPLSIMLERSPCNPDRLKFRENHSHLLVTIGRLTNEFNVELGRIHF